MQALFSPPSTNPHVFWHSPSYLACFLSPWSENSLILALAIVCGQPNSELDYRTLMFAHPRPYKSYTGTIFIYASRSTPSDVLNVIFKSRFTWFRGQFSLGSQNLQQKNARAIFSLFGRQRESFLMVVPQEARSWIFSPLR